MGGEWGRRWTESTELKEKIMFSVWNAVVVKTEGHAREGQAGVVVAVNHAKHPDEVVVRFDADSQEEAVAIADLKAL